MRKRWSLGFRHGIGSTFRAAIDAGKGKEHGKIVV